MALTPKQQMFVNEYLVDLNGTKAAIRAGYGEDGAAVRAHENLKDEEIAAAVKKAMADRAERLKVTQDYVIARLVEVVERAMGEGKLAAANKALETLGRHVGIDKPLEVNVLGQITISHEARLTLGDLFEFARTVRGPSLVVSGELPGPDPVLPTPPHDQPAAGALSPGREP